MSSSSSSISVTDIIGIVIGGVLGLATVVGLIITIYVMCCKKNNQSQVWAQPHPYQSPYGPYGQPANSGYYSQQLPYQQSQQQTLNQQLTNNNDQPPNYSAVDPESSAYGKT
ncbi:unnamed protein product [Rotaria sordida]|uniref:Uncharacterized protein n=1 Tax=Rotaria sordida TaxID=392033 RepID=A0A818SJ84_9BILA|nr:unnamed protein product [Rotaria sordida]CAF1283446.1 unnamed protein product [Rotaria sordida]CAF3670339.1 unnamed protein product [Rotaria sordida]CAF3678767.1 unnamed protein product [Rotaria sordida]